MIAGRPYRPAVPVEEAIAELVAVPAASSTPPLCRSFVDVIERAENGSAPA